MPQDWSELDRRLREGLGLTVPPIAITFRGAGEESSAAPFERSMPPPASDGRTGRVAAGCIFWMEAISATFSTVAADHANCSVGSVTHGFKTLEDVAGNEDVTTLLECDWVSEEAVSKIPVVRDLPDSVEYGPLPEVIGDPDVVLLRVSPRQLMVLHDALPGLRIEGKPQCHIVAIAKEQAEVAASVGCQLSRVRTRMPNGEMTCAIPAASLGEVVKQVEDAAAANGAVARYASADMARFDA